VRITVSSAEFGAADSALNAIFSLLQRFHFNLSRNRAAERLFPREKAALNAGARASREVKTLQFLDDSETSSPRASVKQSFYDR
jgi:hypothetical protein